MTSRAHGFTLIEVIVTVAVMAILLAVGFVNLRPLSNDLLNDTTRVAGVFKQAKIRAISTTSGYRIVKQSGTTLVAQYSVDTVCANTVGSTAVTWTTDPKLSIVLDSDSRLQEQNGVIVCYDSRGLAKSSPTLTLKNSEGKTMKVEVFAGGSVEVK